MALERPDVSRAAEKKTGEELVAAKVNRDETPADDGLVHLDDLDNAPMEKILPGLLLGGLELNVDEDENGEASLEDWDGNKFSGEEGAIEYLAKTRPEEFVSVYSSLLDFDNPENFNRTADLLDELGDVLYENRKAVWHERKGGYWKVPEGSTAYYLEGFFKKILKQEKGSYVLNAYTKDLYKQCKSFVTENESLEMDDLEKRERISRHIQLLSRPSKRYLWRSEITGKRFLSSPSDFAYVTSQINEWRTLELYGDSKRHSEIYGNLFAKTEAKSEPEIFDESYILLPAELKALTTADRKSFMRDYLFFFTPAMHKRIKKDFRCDFTTLTLQEQSHFLAFLRDRTMTEAKTLEGFSRSFGIGGLRTFLVTSKDESLRNKVFEFANTVPKEEAQKVFDAYGKLVSGIDGIGDYLREQFGVENNAAVDSVVERLLVRARLVLASAYERKNSHEAIRELVESVHSENAIFLESFKALRTQEGISFEQAKDLRFERHVGPEMPEESRRQIPELYAKCHVGDPKEYLDQIVADSQKHLDDPNSYFYTLTHKDRLIGMMRFDEKRDREGRVVGLYAGGLNVDPEFGGGRIGDEIIDKTFENERKRGLPIDFHVAINSPLALKYFRGDAVSDKVEEREGVKRFHFILEPGNPYASKHELSLDEMKRRAENRDNAGSIKYVEYSVPPQEIPAGYVLTRLLSQDGKYYAVFEASSSSDRPAA